MDGWVGTEPWPSGRGSPKGACRTLWWAAVRVLPSLSCNTGKPKGVNCSFQGPCQNLTCFPPDIECFGTCDQGVVPVPLLWNQSIVQQPVSFPDLVPLYNKFARNFIADCARQGIPFLLYYASHVGEGSAVVGPGVGKGPFVLRGEQGVSQLLQLSTVLSSQYLLLGALGVVLLCPGLVAAPCLCSWAASF